MPKNPTPPLGAEVNNLAEKDGVIVEEIGEKEETRYINGPAKVLIVID